MTHVHLVWVGKDGVSRREFLQVCTSCPKCGTEAYDVLGEPIGAWRDDEPVRCSLCETHYARQLPRRPRGLTVERVDPDMGIVQLSRPDDAQFFARGMAVIVSTRDRKLTWKQRVRALFWGYV